MQESLKSFDPSNGELVGHVSVTSKDEIPAIVERAKEAQKSWGALTVDQRIAYIEGAAKKIAEKQSEMSRLLSREMGKSLRAAAGEVAGCYQGAVSTATEVKNAIQTKIVSSYGTKTSLQYNPLGVAAVITPWNFPLSMAHWLIIPSLTAGNAVVFKPSEETPLIAQAYVDAFHEVLPKDVLQIVHGADEQGKALVLSDVDLIAFTGSQAAGKEIMRNAAGSLKRLILELGGNDPMLVLKDANIEQAAQFAAGNSFGNAGQVCTSTERIFVDEEIADEFEQKVAAYAKYYKVGPWNDHAAIVGPIINERQRENIISQIRDAVDQGARVLAGGIDHPKHYVLPTVLADVKADMRISIEETFGPVACITRFDDVEEAIAAANHTEYGLGAVVFGGEDAERVANRLEAGMVGINQGVGGYGDVPWVGAKQSGYGYHGSPDGHRQFTQVRVVSGK